MEKQEGTKLPEGVKIGIDTAAGFDETVVLDKEAAQRILSEKANPPRRIIESIMPLGIPDSNGITYPQHAVQKALDAEFIQTMLRQHSLFAYVGDYDNNPTRTPDFAQAAVQLDEVIVDEEGNLKVVGTTMDNELGRSLIKLHQQGHKIRITPRGFATIEDNVVGDDYRILSFAISTFIPEKIQTSSEYGSSGGKFDPGNHPMFGNKGPNRAARRAGEKNARKKVGKNKRKKK